LGAFGTLGDTLRLVGGLAPRYITPEDAPDVPAHAGTSDVDIVLNLAVIAEGQNYADLATQLEARGFARHINAKGNAVTWRWKIAIDGLPIMVEFLRDAEDVRGGGTVPIAGEGVSALAIRHAAIAHTWYVDHKITGELADGSVVTRTVNVVDVVAFVILKALALNSRYEPKDAADLIHVLRYAGTIEHVASCFVGKMQSGQHPQAMSDGMDALHDCFCHPKRPEDSYRTIGPTGYAQFHHADGGENDMLEARRFAAGLVRRLLDEIAKQLKAARKALAT
jgi:hypothetical protein